MPTVLLRGPSSSTSITDCSSSSSDGGSSSSSSSDDSSSSSSRLTASFRGHTTARHLHSWNIQRFIWQPGRVIIAVSAKCKHVPQLSVIHTLDCHSQPTNQQVCQPASVSPHLPGANAQLPIADRHCLAVAQHHGQQVAVSILRLLRGPAKDNTLIVVIMLLVTGAGCYKTYVHAAQLKQSLAHNLRLLCKRAEHTANSEAAVEADEMQLAYTLYDCCCCCCCCCCCSTCPPHHASQPPGQSAGASLRCRSLCR
jgi:hypothetical protein